MKKFLAFIAIALLVVLPMNANAAVTKITITGEDPVVSGTTKTQVIHVAVTSSVSITEVNGTLQLTNATVVADSIKAATGWTNMSTAGSTTNLSFLNSAGASGTNIALFDVTVTGTASTECGVKFLVGDITGEYNENPSTGSSTPYMIIAAGILLVATGLVVSKKKTAIHNI